jgi:hypothetical protein
VLTDAPWHATEHASIHALIADYQQIGVVLGGELTDHSRRVALTGNGLALQPSRTSTSERPVKDCIDTSGCADFWSNRYPTCGDPRLGAVPHEIICWVMVNFIAMMIVRRSGATSLKPC